MFIALILILVHMVIMFICYAEVVHADNGYLLAECGRMVVVCHDLSGPVVQSSTLMSDLGNTVLLVGVFNLMFWVVIYCMRG